MAHPLNELGKTYDLDDRRRAACITACDGLPTEWLERGVIKELFLFIALMALADKVSERKDGFVRTPENWWDEHVRSGLDTLNNFAELRRIQ